MYKEAHPFAFRTIKDWVATLAHTGADDDVDTDDTTSRSSWPEQHRGSYKMKRMSTSRSKHPWELQAEDLQVMESVGVGSHGQVYRGKYKGDQVAVKILFQLSDSDQDSGNADNILTETAAEADALSRLRHVNMMRFYGICYLREKRCIAMVIELCEMDLRTWVDEPGAPTTLEF